VVWGVTHWESAGRKSCLNFHTVVFGVLHKLLSEWGNIFKEWVMAYIYYPFWNRVHCYNYYSTKRLHAAAATKSLQSCPILCDPRDGSPPGSPVPGILQARTLEWVAISFSNAWKWKVKMKLLSCVWLLATPWTSAYQAPPSMGFSRQEYWSGLPLPSPKDCITKYKINF